MSDPHIKKQLIRYLFVGVAVVGFDYAIYRFLLWIGLEVAMAKTFGILAGITASYFSHKYITFQAFHLGLEVMGRYLFVQVLNLGVNVGFNSALLFLLGRHEMTIIVAFLIATACSATVNFLGMKYLAFRC